jgi:CRP-like cAMP-binding protein
MHTQPTATEPLIAFLRATPLFARVEPAVLAEIALELEHLRLEPGAVVIREGEAGDGLYLVMRGRLRVVARAGDGAEIFLNDIEAGEGVGEIALLTGERRTATVYASTAAELLCLSHEQFELIGQRYPAAARDRRFDRPAGPANPAEPGAARRQAVRAPG